MSKPVVFAFLALKLKNNAKSGKIKKNLIFNGFLLKSAVLQRRKPV